MSYILDSSAIFKVIKEGDVETLLSNHTLELARYELGNTIWKQHILHKLSNDELKRLVRLIKEVLSLMEVSGIDCHEEEILSIAEELKLTFYDASYVFHAISMGASLVTEDEQLINNAKTRVRALRLQEIL